MPGAKELLPMQETPSDSFSSHPRGRDVLPRLFRALRGASRDGRPAMRWAEMKPIDFEGEDSSLTQEQLEALR